MNFQIIKSKIAGDFSSVIRISIFFYWALSVPYSSRAGCYMDSTGKEKNDTVPAQKAATKIIKVVGVYNWAHSDSSDKKRNAAGIGDIIIVRVENLKTLLNRANCTDSDGKPIPGCKKQEIRLFLDGRMIKKIAPESGAPLQDHGEMQFHLERNPDNDETWADLLGSPIYGQFFQRPTKVSVGLENEYAENSDVNNFSINSVREFWFWVCVIGFTVYLTALIFLGIKSNILRDRGVDPGILGFVMPAQQPFSLSRFQMAFWFSLVIASFVLIWLITSDYDIVTPGVLALIGISAGTSLSAIVIDSSKGDDLLKKTLELQKEAASLQAEMAALQGGNPIPGEKQARLKQVQAEIETNKNTLTKNISRGFLKDILSDANGVSFHRLQMFVWTLVLGILFIYSVWVRLAMPEFSPTLLALQGITAGTYLGFKIPEKQA